MMSHAAYQLGYVLMNQFFRLHTFKNSIISITVTGQTLCFPLLAFISHFCHSGFKESGTFIKLRLLRF